MKVGDIYDKAFKRILTLSNKAVINLINGLFDSILTINDRDIYHIEAQITEDEEIVFRVFEYGFGHAYKNRTFEDQGAFLYKVPVFKLQTISIELAGDKYEKSVEELQEENTQLKNLILDLQQQIKTLQENNS